MGLADIANVNAMAYALMGKTIQGKASAKEELGQKIAGAAGEIADKISEDRIEQPKIVGIRTTV